MSVKRKCYVALITLLIVMLILPLVAVRVASPDVGMGLFIILFFAVNPFTVFALSIMAGTDIKKLWWVPVLSSVVFPLCFWIVIMDIVVDLFVYSALYLVVGLLAMIGTHIGTNWKKDKLKWALVFFVLIVATIFLYISRSHDGILFFIFGVALYLIALLIINNINKNTKN